MIQSSKKPKQMQLSFCLNQMTVMITNCTIDVSDGEAIVLANLPWSHYSQKLHQNYPILDQLCKENDKEFLSYFSQKRILLLADDEKPLEHKQLRKIIKQFVSQLDPNVMKLVIPYIGYLDKSELSKEIKIYFEEAVHIATDQTRPIHVIMALPEPQAFNQAKKLFSQFMENTCWQT